MLRIPILSDHIYYIVLLKYIFFNHHQLLDLTSLRILMLLPTWKMLGGVHCFHHGL